MGAERADVYDNTSSGACTCACKKESSIAAYSMLHTCLLSYQIHLAEWHDIWTCHNLLVKTQNHGLQQKTILLQSEDFTLS